MATWQQVVRKYYWAIVGPLAVAWALAKVLQWNVADAQLKNYEPAVRLLVHGSYKLSTSGSYRNERRTQTYLLIPLAFSPPFAATIQSVNGEVNVEVDRYWLLKAAVIVMVVIPILRAVSRRLPTRSAGDASQEAPPK
jgi:hypothetical protein